MRIAALVSLILIAVGLGAVEPAREPVHDLSAGILLKDYRPVSIYHIPHTDVPKAKYPAIDVHTHDYAKTAEEVDAWVAAMDAANIARSIILSFATGEEFQTLVTRYGRYPERFELWCYFDFAGWDEPGWSARAVADLERSHRMGARGVGELMDKGMGYKPISASLTSKAIFDTTVGMHINDARMKPLLAKCGELHMPINLHIGEDAWMYQAPDATNDGLMNAAKWRVDQTRTGLADHAQLLGMLEEAVRDNPATTFIACHFANCCADLDSLGRLFELYPNLYADTGARYGEIAPIPRFVHAFMEKYSKRLFYGTDNHYTVGVYPVTFRILESADEHFYEHRIFGYHWPLQGLALSDQTLQDLYRGNAVRVLGER